MKKLNILNILIFSIILFFALTGTSWARQGRVPGAYVVKEVSSSPLATTNVHKIHNINNVLYTIDENGLLWVLAGSGASNFPSGVSTQVTFTVYDGSTIMFRTSTTDSGGSTYVVGENATGSTIFGVSDGTGVFPFTVGGAGTINIKTTDATGILFGSLGTGARGIDLENSGLSGEDFLFYFDVNSYWTAGGRLREQKIETDIITTTTTLGDIRHDVDSTSSLLVGDPDAADTFTNGVSQSGTTQFFHADVSDGNVAVGDLVHITDSSTAADEGFYHIAEISGDTIFVSRNFNGSATNVDVTVYKDVIAFHATDGTDGQQITQHSHTDKPLVIGGEVTEGLTTTHSLGSSDVLFPATATVEFDNTAFFDAAPLLADSTRFRFGNGNDAGLVWSIADASANAFILELSTADTNVAVFAIGDTGVRVADLGWFDGIIDPSIALVSADEAYRSRLYTTTDDIFNVAVGGTTRFQADSSVVTIYPSGATVWVGTSGAGIFVAGDGSLHACDDSGSCGKVSP